MIDKGLIALHKYMISQNNDYLIMFDKSIISLRDVMHIVKQCTNKFIILDDFIYDHNSFKNTQKCIVSTKDRLYSVLKSIFENKSEYSLVENCNIKKTCAVFFSLSNAIERDVKVYEHFLLFRKLPKSFGVTDIIFDGQETAIPVYTNRKEYKKFKISAAQKPICVFLGYGIGDFFITSDFWYKLLEMHKNIVIVIPKNRPIKRLLQNLFGAQCTFFEIEDYMVLEYIYRIFVDSGKFSKCYNLLFSDYKMINNFQHYYDYFGSQMFDIHIDKPYSYINKIVNTISKLLSDSEQREIAQIQNTHKLKIGIQFWTDEPGAERKWNEQNVQELINKGNSEYQFYILTPFPAQNYNINGAVDLSGLSINGMITAIKQLDLVVGIDSCCGHIAAAFDIPTITLWNTQTPVMLQYDYIKLSFRALRRNISLVPKNKNINEITGENVYNIIQKYYNKEIIMDSNILSNKEIFQLKNTFYV